MNTTLTRTRRTIRRHALAATITGTLLTLAPIPPQTIRDTRSLIDPDAPYEQDADVTADLRLIARINTWLPRCTEHGPSLEINLRERGHAEDRLLAAHGHQPLTDAQRYTARLAAGRAADTVRAAAEQAHPVNECAACRGWEDCETADRAYRDALHTDWVTRWNV